MNAENDSNALEDALVPVAVRVRRGDGLDRADVDRALAAIRNSGERWKLDECVSLPEARLIAAIYADLEAASYLYPDAEAEQIREAARQLNDAILEGLAQVATG